MRKNTLVILAAFMTLMAVNATARSARDSAIPSIDDQYHKFYLKGGMDASIFSSAFMKYPSYTGTINKMATLRYTLFFNIGNTFHYDLNKHTGLFTGLDIKNVGFIEKDGNQTTKRRTYSIGVPLGIKFGPDINKDYLFAGLGLDMPFNYKEKTYVVRSNKTKFNEWFSDRTPAFMPCIFAGYSLTNGATIKLQYYFNNFLNPNYAVNNNGVIVQPYAGYNVHIIMLSMGFAMRYHKDHAGKPKDKAPELRTASLQ